MTDRVGQQLGNYKLIRLVGAGGFAEVYVGEHIYLKTQAAIKVLRMQLSGGEDIDNFLNEARTIAHLKHNNIIRVLDFGIDEQKTPYLIMDYAPHGTLRHRYPRGQRLPLATVLPHIKEIASALQYAHDQQIIHRDVKPENFLLGLNDEVLLSDFGIAIVSQNSLLSIDTHENVAGTMTYMAPEQVMGKSRSASDQYSLGAVVYEWLCGVPPFRGSFAEVTAQHLYATPPSLHAQVPEISLATEIIVLTALAKDPQQRFASVNAFANALENVYRLENPDQVRDKLILPGSSTQVLSKSFSKVAPTLPAGHSAITEEHTITLPAPEENVGIEDMQTILIVADPLKEGEKTVPPLSESVTTEKCPFCGADTRPGDNFCLTCGNRLPVSPYVAPALWIPEVSDASVHSEESFIQTAIAKIGSSPPTPPINSPPPPVSSSWEKCPFCGANTRPGDNFCLGCGNRLLTSPSAPSVVLPAMGEATFAAQEGWGTIADRFEPDFATAVPHYEEAAHSFMVPPGTLAIDAQAGLSLDQVKQQLFIEGDVHYSAKRYKEAFSAYQRIIQVDAREVRAHGGKGNALARLGRYKEALEAYITALDIDATHASIWSAKGDMLAKQRNYDEALVAYNQALTLNPKDALTWRTKGSLLVRLRNYDEALLAYESALDLKPKDAVTWGVKGNLHYKLEQYDQALVAYTHSLEIAPKKYLIWEARGDVLSKLKRYGEALVVYERADILNPGNANLIHKCVMHRELKRQQEDALLQTAILEANTQIFPPAGPSKTRPRRNPSSARHQIAKQENGAEDKTQILEVFDVFLSYSEEDASWVEELARYLEDEGGVQVWLDKWILIPGEPWIPAKAEAIEQARSCIVCIGGTTPVEWFEQEIQKAIKRQKSEPNSNFRVIPVLLPNAKNENARSNLKNFLELNTWVDFRTFDYDYAFHLLLSGIRGEPPGRWPPEVPDAVSQEAVAEKKLRQLRRFNLEGIVDDSLIVEYQRQILTQIWLRSEEDIDE